MAEELKNPQEPQTPVVEEPEIVSLSKEDAEALQESADTHDRMETEAQALGYAGVDDLILAASQPVKPASAEPAVKPAATKPPEPTPPPIDADKVNAELRYSSQTAHKAMIESQWGTFKMMQENMPEEMRSKHTRAELEKAMFSPQGVRIEELTRDPRYESNYFAAAADLLDIDNVRAKAQKEGADSEKALKGAAETASIASGGAPAPPEEDKTDPAQQLADLIAPEVGTFAET
jgi:hypothetical protein